jgi:hypothetical protein
VGPAAAALGCYLLAFAAARRARRQPRGAAWLLAVAGVGTPLSLALLGLLAEPRLLLHALVAGGLLALAALVARRAA